jgi:N-acetylglucosaminyl-diphospho-decaprenol L-rhamnosyltransferase
MLVKREVLERTGGFDEQFFMYAEDIDLSYRISLAGYTNYYIAESMIIHFKGESTRKDAKYAKLFYKAMSQFTHKHFKRGFSAWFTFLMDIAIGFGAWALTFVQLFRRERETLPADDTTAVYIMGDPLAVARLKERLADSKKRIVDDPELAFEIILCEGTAFSFKMIIEMIRKNPGRAYLIHASGSGSIVGSRSGHERGEAIIL